MTDKQGRHECPPASWHVLEVIVNVLMVLEVSTRWIAYGKVGAVCFPQSADHAEISYDATQCCGPPAGALLRHHPHLRLRKSLWRGDQAYVFIHRCQSQKLTLDRRRDARYHPARYP